MKTKKRENNIAYIDGQNLHMGVQKKNWRIDLLKFRIYLQDKYKVEKAYYFLGYLNESFQDLYTNLQEAGFIIKFKEHNSLMMGKKKGNVDTDIVFEIMKKIINRDDFNKIVLISGDGDYKKLVDFLIEKNKFEKVLFPNKEYASSLYKKIGHKYFAHIEDIKKIVEYKKKGA